MTYFTGCDQNIVMYRAFEVQSVKRCHDPEHSGSPGKEILSLYRRLQSQPDLILVFPITRVGGGKL
jgi:hypothetical protein